MCKSVCVHVPAQCDEVVFGFNGLEGSNIDVPTMNHLTMNLLLDPFSSPRLRGNKRHMFQRLSKST